MIASICMNTKCAHRGKCLAGRAPTLGARLFFGSPEEKTNGAWHCADFIQRPADVTHHHIGEEVKPWATC